VLQYAKAENMQTESTDKERAELADSIQRNLRTRDQLEPAIPSLKLFRYSKPSEPQTGMYPPSVCLIAQGAKRVVLGNEKYIYDSNHILVTSVNVPTISQVIEASEKQPCLGIVFALDLNEVSQLIIKRELPSQKQAKIGPGMAVCLVTASLFKSFQRLIDLLDEPENISMLAPLVEKEILYRLLMSDQGPRLRQMATAGNYGHQIAQAVEWMQKNYTESFRIEDLSSDIGMSLSSFHHHFRTVTTMTPLQYQKWLRLHKARQLMLTERMDAASASFEVGYESASQFSREYSRLFGAPPMRDINNILQTSETIAVQ